MKRTTINLSNDFHNSYTSIRAKLLPNKHLFVTQRAWNAACRRLCGMGDCECSSVRGLMLDNARQRYGAEEHQEGIVLFPA